MRAAVLTGPRRLEVQALEVPEPQPGEVLVRIEGCGVCGSNGPAWQGRSWLSYPFAPGEPGHEGWGVVERSGFDNGGPEPGTRVALLSQRAFAEYDVAPAEAVVPLPAAVEGPFPGEAVGCAMNALRRSGIGAESSVAVVGIGFLGALLVQLAVGAGARVTALSRRLFALDIARRCGAHAAFELADRLHEEFDVVIESAGSQETLDLASRLVRTRGRLVVVGYHQDGPRSVDMQLWNWKGIDVVNAHERDPAVYVEGIRLGVAAVAERRLDLAPLITHSIPLDDAGRAFELARTRPDGFLKAVVTT